MELFDFDITTKKVSKYETNHLHMYVDGDIEFPDVQNMSDESYATFLHEYIHYIQHVSTLFGVRICDMNQRVFLLYRDYMINHDEIKIPLYLWDNDHKLKTFRESFSRIAGDRSCSHNIDAVDINFYQIEEASRNRTAINIGIYDYENQKIIENGFKFGYFCIIESMAHAIQSIVNQDLHHDIVPYKAVTLILKEIAPEYADDLKMIASFCLCALHWDNPGVGFFDVIKIQKEFCFKNGLELYRHVARDYSVSFQNKETPRYRLMEHFLEELKKSLQQLVGSSLEYYNRVLDSCKNEARLSTSKLLEVLYNGDIADKGLFIKELADYYGFPLIDANNYTAMPLNICDGQCRPYRETACICGMELIISRLLEIRKDIGCRRWRICSLNMYSDPDNCLATEECLSTPWEKEERCLFTEALRYYGFEKKKFVVKE